MPHSDCWASIQYLLLSFLPKHQRFKSYKPNRLISLCSQEFPPSALSLWQADKSSYLKYVWWWPRSTTTRDLRIQRNISPPRTKNSWHRWYTSHFWITCCLSLCVYSDRECVCLCLCLHPDELPRGILRVGLRLWWTSYFFKGKNFTSLLAATH